MARRLSVVPPGAKPARKRRPTTIKGALAGSERDVLVALRAKAAADLDAGVPAHAVAPLMRQLRDLDKEIRSIDAREEQESESGPTPDEEWSAI